MLVDKDFNDKALPLLDSLLRRTLGMLYRFRDGLVPSPSESCEGDQLKQIANEIAPRLYASAKELPASFVQDLGKWLLEIDSILQEKKPWLVFQEERKNKSTSPALDTLLYNLLESLRLVAVVVQPYNPSLSNQVLHLLCDAIDTNKEAPENLLSLEWACICPGTKCRTAQSLIPGGHMEEAKQETTETKPESEETPKKEEPKLATFDDFLKVDLRVAQIMEAVKLEKSEKLVKLQIDLGEQLGGRRQIVAGIAKHYAAEDLVGKKIAVVANLKPAKLMGEVSQGMLLAASDNSGNLTLVDPGDSMPVGSKIS
jgi:methionyl-tRNA synthetase